MEKITHQMRREQWSKIISECLASGQSKTAWCKQNGISDKAFFYWQKILRREAYALAVPADKASSLPTVLQPTTVPFVELKFEQNTSEGSVYNDFKPDAVIQAKGLLIGLTNSASPDLINAVGGLINAE